MPGFPVLRAPGDLNTGHPPCFPPAMTESGSTDVLVENLMEFRLTDKWLPHCCAGCHPAIQVGASATVFTDNLPVARVTDLVSCSPLGMVGSPTVIVG